MPEKSHYLCLLRPTRLGMVAEGPTDREAEVVGRHFAYLQGLQRGGALVLAGRTLNADEKTVGISVFAASSASEARAVVAADPAVREGVMTAEVYPYRIALISEANASLE